MYSLNKAAFLKDIERLVNSAWRARRFFSDGSNFGRAFTSFVIRVKAKDNVNHFVNDGQRIVIKDGGIEVRG